MKLYSPNNCPGYQLIDCGDFEKLERFGKFTLIRPEPQAVWPRVFDTEKWNELAHARFVRKEQKVSYRTGDSINGGWTFLKHMPESWVVAFKVGDSTMKMKLALTSFGHIGIFPEQANNWEYLHGKIKSLVVESPKILNAFAYTGGASLAANIAGADVTHLDAVKQVVSWTNENMELSGLKGIRWMVDDALKFVKREEKRGKMYNGIILDPPAYGRGPAGEKWVLEEGVNELLHYSSKILLPEKSFFILNLYSLGFSSLIAKNLVDSHFEKPESEFGEFFLQAESGVKLPLGTFVRFAR